MAIARFPRPEGKAGFGLVKNAARQGIRDLGDASFDAQAPLSGQRAMTRRCVGVVTPFAFGYGVEVALTVRALRAGLTVVEVPTTMTHAATGRDVAGFVHRGRQYLHVKRSAQEAGPRDASVALSADATSSRDPTAPGHVPACVTHWRESDTAPARCRRSRRTPKPPRSR